MTVSGAPDIGEPFESEVEHLQHHRDVEAAANAAEESAAITALDDRVTAAEAAIIALETALPPGADIYIASTASTPVDYTDGDPPATGEGVYGKGSLVVALDTGVWYRNSGTQAEPLYTALADTA